MESLNIKIVRRLLQFDLLQDNTTDVYDNATMAAVLAEADWQTALWTGVFIFIAVVVSIIVVGGIESEDITSWIVVDLQEKSI